jgi:hypothetical protein
LGLLVNRLINHELATVHCNILGKIILPIQTPCRTAAESRDGEPIPQECSFPYYHGYNTNTAGL